MKVGLLSDTHGFLDPSVEKHFRSCDEIWHAGDIGDEHVADSLAAQKPLRAVYGNVDDLALRTRFPEDQKFTCEGLNVWMTHIGGTPGKYPARIKDGLKKYKPDIFICGHSHILLVKKDTDFGVLYLNPGAAGNHGFHVMKTLLRLEIVSGKIAGLEVIELGKRGQLPTKKPSLD
jgi:uncharacterized protein